MTAQMSAPLPVQPPVPGPRTVTTASGSRYRIDGHQLTKLTGDDPDRVYELVDFRSNRLRYTDGSRLYISTPVQAA